MRHIINKKKNFNQIKNIDETPLALSSPTNRTVNETSAKTVSMLIIGYEKASFIYVSVCAAKSDHF